MLLKRKSPKTMSNLPCRVGAQPNQVGPAAATASRMDRTGSTRSYPTREGGSASGLVVSVATCWSR
eukprot:293688-Chlamydomonas_euryale.AAC.1